MTRTRNGFGILTAAVAALIVTAGAGCSSGGAPSPAPVPEVSDPGQETTTPAVLETFSVSAMLDLVARPPAFDPLRVTVGDLDAASELVGAVRPTDPEDGEATLAWLGALGRPVDPDSPVSSLLPSFYGQQSADRVGRWQDDLGWSLVDVRSFVSAGAPPSEIDVLVGTVEPDAITKALGEPVDGIWAQPGVDGSITPDGTSFDPLGRPIRLAVREDAMAISFSAPALQTWLDGPTLADDPVLTAVAGALDNQDVYSAMLLRRDFFALPFSLGSTGVPATEIAAEEPVPGQLAPFDTVGVGLAVVDGSARAVLVHHHPDADAAAENASRLPVLLSGSATSVNGRPIGDMVELVDVRVEGKLVVSTLSFADGVPPQTIWLMAQQEDVLFQHG